MGSLKKIMVVSCLGFALLVQAQTKEIVRPGLLSAQLTLSPAHLFSSKANLFYAHGSAEAYLEKDVSLAGEVYYCLGTISNVNSLFIHNHSLFFGVNQHWVMGNSDWYVGFQPGVSYVQLNAMENNLMETKAGIAPIASVVLGYNYFVSPFFHFYIQSRLLTGRHFYNQRIDLSEFRFSAGLGLNIHTIKSK